MVDIIEAVGGERMARRSAYGFEGPSYFKRDSRGRLVEDLDSQGNDTEYDSMDLMVRSMTAGGDGQEGIAAGEACIVKGVARGGG